MHVTTRVTKPLTFVAQKLMPSLQLLLSIQTTEMKAEEIQREWVSYSLKCYGQAANKMFDSHAYLGPMLAFMGYAEAQALQLWKEVKKLWRIVYIEGPLYKQNGTHASVSDKRWAADGRVKVVLRTWGCYQPAVRPNAQGT